jgi:hypothetical protein
MLGCLKMTIVNILTDKFSHFGLDLLGVSKTYPRLKKDEISLYRIFLLKQEE